MANKKELIAIIQSYKETFASYLKSNNDPYTNGLMRGKWEMIRLFLDHMEIHRIENEVRVNENKTIIEYFETVESWTKQFEGKIYKFEWTAKGLQSLKEEFSWVDNKDDYRKFILSINLILERLEKVAA